MAHKTCYLTPGLQLNLTRQYAARKRDIGVYKLLAVLPSQPSIPLVAGQRLVLTREALPGQPARYDGSGRVVADAHISCGAPEAFKYVRTGERILFDDGRIGGVVESIGDDRLVVDLVDVPGGTAKLKAERGINFPDSDLGLPALSRKDPQDLKFVVEHADMVGLSFVRRPEDVHMLQDALRNLGRPDMGIVLKIETRAGFEALPELLLATMASPYAGVMIARGDLAVECVMLNKGAHIVDAIRVLDDILSRMQGHQRKKSATLRRLRAWDRIETGHPDSQAGVAMRG